MQNITIARSGSIVEEHKAELVMYPEDKSWRLVLGKDALPKLWFRERVESEFVKEIYVSEPLCGFEIVRRGDSFATELVNGD